VANERKIRAIKYTLRAREARVKGSATQIVTEDKEARQFASDIVLDV
jgi:hypothetical protein